MTSTSGFGSTGAPGGIPDLPPLPPTPSSWQPPSTPVPTGTSGPGASTTDVAKDQATSVALDAKDAAKDVAGTAKEQVGQVADEAKKQAKDFVGQARSELTDQASTQQQRVAVGLHSVSDQLHALANGDAQQGPANDLAHQAADKVPRSPGSSRTVIRGSFWTRYAGTPSAAPGCSWRWRSAPAWWPVG